MPERPDIVRGGPEIDRESIAAAEILIGCVDGFGAGIKLRNAAAGAGVVFLSHLPDRPGLPIQVFAAQSQAAGNCGVDATARLPSPSVSSISGLIASIVEIPTLDNDSCSITGFRLSQPALPEIGELAVSCLRPPEILQSVGFSHQLSERLTTLTIVLQDRLPPGCLGTKQANLARNLSQIQGQCTG
jgi:hypothetical protein